MLKPKMILVFIIILIFIAIFIQNREVVTFDLLWWDFKMPRFFLPILVIASGAIGFFLARLKGGKKNKKET